jgi:lipopolysaccharide biosynthesis glycosyltransferase
VSAIEYVREPQNDSTEVHICFRCSDAYAIYAPTSVYSILTNNQNSFVYIYFLTDGISDERWAKIIAVAAGFSNCEIIKFHPDPEDIESMEKKSSSYHGWGLVHISIYYQKYLDRVHKVFNFGIDTFCVGDLTAILSTECEGYHYIGSSSRHQKPKSRLSLSPTWIGFDTALLNLNTMRRDGITPDVLAEYSIKAVGYIHDEVAHNGICERKFLDPKLYYIFSGSYLPNKKMDPETRVVDFYSNLKPWDVAVRGHEVFDRYVDYYEAVSKIIEVEYKLPSSITEVSASLRAKGYPFLDWLPIRLPFFGETLYRLGWAIKKLRGRFFC